MDAEQVVKDTLGSNEALWAAERLLRESIETYEGRNQRVVALLTNDFGKILAQVRQALGQPPYVAPWEIEAEELAAQARWGH